MVAHADARASLLAAEGARLEAGTSELQRPPTKSESRSQSRAARYSHHAANGRHPSPRPLLARAKPHRIAAEMSLGPGADVVGPLLVRRRQVAVMMRKGLFWDRENPAAIPRRGDTWGPTRKACNGLDSAFTSRRAWAAPRRAWTAPWKLNGTAAWAFSPQRWACTRACGFLSPPFRLPRAAALSAQSMRGSASHSACGTGPTFRRASGNRSTQGRA